MRSGGNTPDALLGAELLSVIARLNRWSTRHANSTLPIAQARLLAQLEELEAARIGDLARADHCSQPGKTMQVRRLKASGLIRRVPDPADARAVLVSLTPQGRQILREVREARAAAIAPLVTQLSDTGRSHLRDALDT